MENNKDSNTNMMDLLPNEMVIKIFEHFENVTDLLTLPKVNYRFTELSKLKCNRNHLQIKENEIAAYSKEEFQMKLQNEMNKCRDLKTITYTINLIFKYGYFMKSIINAENRDKEHEFYETDKICLRMYNDEFKLCSFLKKNADDMDMSRVVQMAPSDMTDIGVQGSSKIFQTAIEKNTDILNFATFEGSNITYVNLNAIGKCNKLRKVKLSGNLVVTDEVPETFHVIQAKEIILFGNFHCPYVANLFFSETLEFFSVDYCTIAGFENELFTKCTKLEYLSINMESEREDIENYQIIDSIIELVDTLKHHETLQLIDIYNVNQLIHNSLSEPLSESLESFPDSEIDMSRSDFGLPKICINLNMNLFEYSLEIEDHYEESRM